jgi:hypothetical protein
VDQGEKVEPGSASNKNLNLDPHPDQEDKSNPDPRMKVLRINNTV